MITLDEFMQLYGGSSCISIDGYCEEERFDYYTLPSDPDDLSDNNPNHYKPTCLQLCSWWDDVKDRLVKRFNVIGGGCYTTELVIELEQD